MPYIKQKDYEKLIAEQKTTSGITTFAGNISNELDELDYQKALDEYATIRNSDSVASATLDILKLPIIFADWEIVLDEYCDTDQGRAIQEYLYFTLDSLYDSWSGFIKHALLKYDFGSSWFEKVWKRGYDYQGKKTNILTRLYPFQNHTIYRFEYNDKMDLTGIIFKKYLPERGLSEYISIQVSDLFYLVNEMEFNDVRGKSILRTVRIPCELKRRIMLADARTAERGAGIVRGRVTGNMNESEKGQFQTTLSTVSNSKNGFFLDQKDKFEIDIVPLDGQQNNIERLKYYDTMSFYNTLTQFMSSGISTSYGSRSTADVLQTPYELKVMGSMKEIEDGLNQLLYEVVQNSYFGNVDKQAMPLFKFSNPKKQDMASVAQNIVNLANARGLTFRPEDEVYFRRAFGMPEITLQTLEEEQSGKVDTSIDASAALYIPMLQAGIISPEEMRDLLKLPVKEGFKPTPLLLDPTVQQAQQAQTEQTKKQETNNTESEMSCTHKHIELENKPAISELCRQIFELSSAEETFSFIDTAAENVVNMIYEKLVREWASQLAENPKRIPGDRFKGELISKLTALYNQARQRGMIDIKKEISKLVDIEKAENRMELSSENIKQVNTDKRMALKITKLYETLSNQIQEDLANQTVQSIDNKGGIERYIIDKYLTSNVRPRNDLKTFTGNGYTAGRLEEIENNKKYIELYEYVGVLDKNICKKCAPLDGVQMSLDDWTAAGMNTKKGEQNLNPDCLGLLGDNTCRCQLVPIKLIDIEKIERPDLTPTDQKATVKDNIQERANTIGNNPIEQKKYTQGDPDNKGNLILLYLAADIYAKYAGTGQITDISPTEIKEKITASENIGEVDGQPTKSAIIHYTNNGYFIEPTK